MPRPQVVAVAEGSPADRAGICPGDEIATMNGTVPRDVIEYQLIADQAILELELRRGGLELEVAVEKDAGEPLGIEVSSAIFDRVRTCDNHCEFCFIYQLPKGMRRSLYQKDDDYRLSFLYGNFTTLTRFTEADLERVVDQHLSPLYVSIHATDPEVRAAMLQNRRGAISLRWLACLLEAGIEVHGQVVVCPGVNDGAVLEHSLAGILDAYPELASAAVVPLGVSRYSRGQAMRAHSPGEAADVVEVVQAWQERFVRALGRPLVFVSDEYYLLAGIDPPPASAYGDFAQHENGIGMIRAFEEAFEHPDPVQAAGQTTGTEPVRKQTGFFAWVDGAPGDGYRAPRTIPVTAVRPRTQRGRAPVTILTGEYGEQVLRPLLDRNGFGSVAVRAVRNDFFGGNIAVAGLLSGPDVARVLDAEPEGRSYLLPDVCLSRGRFLDGSSPEDLPRPVQIVDADGASLRRVLEAAR